MEKSMIKKASEELLRIADEIEKEASEKIFFARDSCDHQANLATIDAARKEASESASDESKKVTVASISVDDSLACPACDSGIMKYAASEESEKYIVEASEEDYDAKEEKAEKAEKDEDKEEKEAAKVEEEEPKEDENPLMKKAASLGLDLDAISRYSDI